MNLEIWKYKSKKNKKKCTNNVNDNTKWCVCVFVYIYVYIYVYAQIVSLNDFKCDSKDMKIKRCNKKLISAQLM